MKNTIYIKKIDIENLECECCAPKDLININGVDMLVDRQFGLRLLEGESYELYLDITNGKPDHEGYQQFFLENEPILDELNEYYGFLSEGTISKTDFDILLEGKVGVFEPECKFESETHTCANGYQIIGQAKDEFLVANNIYFYIGKNRETRDEKFLVAYCESPLLCQELSI